MRSRVLELARAGLPDAEIALTLTRCGARTPGGSLCRSPAVRGKRRCRMHGAWAGPPRGNRNALKHGQRTAEALASRRRVRELLAEARDPVEEADR